VAKVKILITDSSVVKTLGKQTKVYDDQQNDFYAGAETRLYISSDSLKNEYYRKSFVLDWLSPTVNPGYNPDDGVYIGGGVIYKKQQFGKVPYGSMQLLGANYAFSTGAYSLWYKGEFKDAIAHSDLQLGVLYNSPTYTRNFYGMGNETVNHEAAKDYYRVRIGQLSVSSSLHRQIGKQQELFYTRRISVAESGE
jgi:hypothetical protein